MLSFGQSTPAARRFLRKAGFAQTTLRPRILVISADVGFYSSVLSAACSLGWSADWAPTISRGLEICAFQPAHIVIYDQHLPRIDWRNAFDRLAETAERTRILLATQSIDEELWRTVLRRRGYDVLARFAGTEQLRRELRFAWLSLQESRIPASSS